MKYVEIVERKTGKVVECMECRSEREATRVHAGASINLNHEDYKVRTVDKKTKAKE